MSRIYVENLSINFRIYHDRSPFLKDYFVNFFKRKQQIPHTDLQAVKNVSFEIGEGERVGIVGHNGAGKSTLLKALCRIYETYEGTISTEGTIAPLLEVGAGFNPEFTGRENIYLQGAILGYSKRYIKEIEDEVIAFAELDGFANTLVKYYSTGMYMRLAFSLATAIQPDILVLDEVFAGGDAGFMIKAKKRMYDIIDRANIMLMVSHDINLIQSLCNRVIWMDHGRIIGDGPPEETARRYLASIGNT